MAYDGFDDGQTAAAVFVSNRRGPMERLPLGCDIVSHSPSGFAWSYRSSGPS